MKTATLTEAKNRLGALIDQVRAGETVTILDRGIPVARLEPVVALPDAAGRIRRLERSGLIRVATAPPPVALLHEPAPELEREASAVAVILEERRTGR